MLNVSIKKIDRLKKRFVEEGLEAALDGAKSQRIYERKTDGDFQAHLLALSCSKPPEGRARWTLRLLADKVVKLEYIDSVSHETIRQIQKNKLKPRRKVGWVIPPAGDASFMAQMEQVLDIYRRPRDERFPVVCMDESPKQLIGGNPSVIRLNPLAFPLHVETGPRTSPAPPTNPSTRSPTTPTRPTVSNIAEGRNIALLRHPPQPRFRTSSANY